MYNQNNRIGIKLLCSRIRSTSLGEITSRPETEHETKQCMQSRHSMPDANQYRRPVFDSWNCATRHPERCMSARMENTKQETMPSILYMGIGYPLAERMLMSRNCFLRSVKPAEFSSKVRCVNRIRTRFTCSRDRNRVPRRRHHV